MSISRFAPPLDYLRAASRSSLQSFELARLNHAANLRREIAVLIDQWIQESSEATLARWMLDHHESLHSLSPSSTESPPAFPEPARDPLPDLPAPPGDIVRAGPNFSDAQRRVTASIGRKAQKQRASAAG
jgi:hypothetical protein